MILVTGANGFIGSALVDRLLSEGARVRAAVRKDSVGSPQVDTVSVGDISDTTDWSAALAGVQGIVHTAARVHVMKDTHALADLYKRVNTDATLNLARQAAAAGVKRFVFLSSIKVNGEETSPGARFSAISTPAPVDPYGVSKLEAERGLFALAHSTGMEVVVIRPVLVYGPGVKGNFARMASWIEKGVPLPFGSIRNLRSMIALENLIDVLVLSLKRPAAKNQIFMVSDGEDLSTSDLLRRTAHALGKRSRIFPFPAGLLLFAARAIGRGDMATRLFGSLQVDITKTRELLEWTPRVSVDTALEQYAGWKRAQS